MDYAIRPLNILDIREMAKILKEIDFTKSDVAAIAGNIFEKATELSAASDDGKSLNEFIQALTPAADLMITLFAESDTFWVFLGSLLKVSYEELAKISLFEIRNIFTALLSDEQVQAFFTSISEAKVKRTAE